MAKKKNHKSKEVGYEFTRFHLGVVAMLSIALVTSWTIFVKTQKFMYSEAAGTLDSTVVSSSANTNPNAPVVTIKSPSNHFKTTSNSVTVSGSAAMSNPNGKIKFVEAIITPASKPQFKTTLKFNAKQTANVDWSFVIPLPEKASYTVIVRAYSKDVGGFGEPAVMAVVKQ